MAAYKLVAVTCRLSSGVFSDERFFSVPLANGETYRSSAPSHYFWNERGCLVREKEPSAGDEILGKLAARLVEVENLPEGQIALEIPDGEVIAVKKDLVGPRPTEIKPYVSLGS